MDEQPATTNQGPPDQDRRPRAEVDAPVREFHMRWIDRIGDTAFRGLARLGLGPASLLTTKGRRTGRSRMTPVIPLQHGDRQWLVAPYGDVSWVLNARAAGHVCLRHGKHSCEYTVREVPDVEAGPILKQYVAVARATRPYFRSHTASPVSEFVAEAHLHPVFELTVSNADISG